MIQMNLTAKQKQRHRHRVQTKRMETKEDKGDGMNGETGVGIYIYAAAAAASRQSRPTLCDPIDGSPPGSRPWDSPGKNTGVGYHFFLQCMKVKSESEVAQSC